eukprot:g839.t1
MTPSAPANNGSRLAAGRGAGAGAKLTIRIRGPSGMWRLKDVEPNTTIGAIMKRVEKEYGVPCAKQSIFLDPGNKQAPKSASQTLLDVGKARNGDMLYLKFDTSEVAVVAAAKAAAGPALASSGSLSRTIGADGTIIASQTSSAASNAALRPGLMSLRSKKLHWTMEELQDLEAQYTFKIKGGQKAVCSGVSLDSDMCRDFQAYVRQFDFQRYHCGWLYGRYVKKLADSKAKRKGPTVDSFGRKLKVQADEDIAEQKKLLEVQVECIYEPPQTCTATTIELSYDDPNEELVERTAKSLGLHRVGFIYAHPGPRAEGFHMAANEVILCAENQLLAGDEKKESPFVTVKVTKNEQGESDFQAFQMTKQCLELVAEGALLHDPAEPRACLVNDTFSVLVETKEVSRVDNDFFLCNVPIMQHQSFLKTRFRHPHRMHGHQWNTRALQSFMREQKRLPLLDRISDFNALLLLAKLLDKESMKAVCTSVHNREIPLEDGYKLMVDSLSTT